MAFNAGEFHGVKAVTSGRRCAIALWFTLNKEVKKLDEATRTSAYLWLEKKWQEQQENFESLESRQTTVTESKGNKDEL